MELVPSDATEMSEDPPFNNATAARKARSWTLLAFISTGAIGINEV